MCNTTRSTGDGCMLLIQYPGMYPLTWYYPSKVGNNIKGQPKKSSGRRGIREEGYRQKDRKEKGW